jgi:hypothetical protein
MTTEQCNLCIDHIYKVVPVCILMKGAATATVPNFLFRERSCGKNIIYFNQKLTEIALPCLIDVLDHCLVEIYGSQGIFLR